MDIESRIDLLSQNVRSVLMKILEQYSSLRLIQLLNLNENRATFKVERDGNQSVLKIGLDEVCRQELRNTQKAQGVVGIPTLEKVYFLEEGQTAFLKSYIQGEVLKEYHPLVSVNKRHQLRETLLMLHERDVFLYRLNGPKFN